MPLHHITCIRSAGISMYHTHTHTLLYHTQKQKVANRLLPFFPSKVFFCDNFEKGKTLLCANGPGLENWSNKCLIFCLWERCKRRWNKFTSKNIIILNSTHHKRQLLLLKLLLLNYWRAYWQLYCFGGYWQTKKIEGWNMNNVTLYMGTFSGNQYLICLFYIVRHTPSHKNIARLPNRIIFVFLGDFFWDFSV